MGSEKFGMLGGVPACGRVGLGGIFQPKPFQDIRIPKPQDVILEETNTKSQMVQLGLSNEGA